MLSRGRHGSHLGIGGAHVVTTWHLSCKNAMSRRGTTISSMPRSQLLENRYFLVNARFLDRALGEGRPGPAHQRHSVRWTSVARAGDPGVTYYRGTRAPAPPPAMPVGPEMRPIASKTATSSPTPRDPRHPTTRTSSAVEAPTVTVSKKVILDDFKIRCTGNKI